MHLRLQIQLFWGIYLKFSGCILRGYLIHIFFRKIKDLSHVLQTLSTVLSWLWKSIINEWTKISGVLYFTLFLPYSLKCVHLTLPAQTNCQMPCHHLFHLGASRRLGMSHTLQEIRLPTTRRFHLNCPEAATRPPPQQIAAFLGVIKLESRVFKSWQFATSVICTLFGDGEWKTWSTELKACKGMVTVTSKDGGSEGHGLNHLRWRCLAHQCQKRKRRRYEANPEHVKKNSVVNLSSLGIFCRRQSRETEWFSRDHPETNSRMGPNAPEKGFTRKPGVFEKGGSYQTTRVSWLV